MLIKSLLVILIMSTFLEANWDEYKSLFIAKDGRVIDRVNSDITHSESIGYAMYLALQNNDLNTFKKVHEWYTNNLKTDENGLISWKWGKAKDGNWRVLDTNNATDGELWIAYDNLLMFERTKEPLYRDKAIQIIKSIKSHLIVEEQGMLFLLPGREGFNKKNSLEINLSYYLFFIFDKFKNYDNDNIWSRLKSDGIKLLQKSQFTPLSLHPDWVKIDKKSLKVQLSKNSSFGYDAIRIPYNIMKSEIKEKKNLLEPYGRYIKSMKSAKTIFGVVDLENAVINMYNYSFAHLSVYNMIDKYFNNTMSFSDKVKKLKGENKNDYYSYSIYLFTTSN